MNLPKIPNIPKRSNLDDTIIELIDSLAKEELALSSLIVSESDKIKAFIGVDLNFPTKPTTLEILTFNQSITKLMDTVLMKEWLLLKKLETISQIKSSLQCSHLESSNAIETNINDQDGSASSSKDNHLSLKRGYIDE